MVPSLIRLLPALPSRLLARTVLWLAAAASLNAAPPNAPPDPHGSASIRPVEGWPSWWQVGGEMRGRLDYYSGMSGVAGGRDAYYLSRVRLNSAFRLRPWMRVFVQAQDSRAFDYDRSPCPKTTANSLDLRQAYLDVGSSEDGWRLRAGRQPLAFGDTRLVSTSNWGNVGPGFDGVRLSYRRNNTRLDAWGSFVVQPGDGFDRPRRDRRFHGVYYSFDTPGRSRTVDVYALWKDYQALRLDVVTLGVRSTGKLGGTLDYNVETVIQRGRSNRDSVGAWAGHWELIEPLGRHARAPRLSLEYNHASGDRDRNDGRLGTFDTLFSTGVYATAGDFAWRNINEPMATLDWRPAGGWRIKTSYRWFWLADRRDALYTIAGTVFVHNPQARHSRVGSEADIRAIWQATRHLQLWTGYGNLFPGPYLRESGRGKPLRYPYALWTYTL